MALAVTNGVPAPGEGEGMLGGMRGGVDLVIGGRGSGGMRQLVHSRGRRRRRGKVCLFIHLG